MASTARQATLLLLLTLQVGVQPLLMGWYAVEARDVRLRVGVVELLKLLLALIPLSLSRGEGGLLNQLKTWKLRAALATTVMPALIYVLQNLLNHAAVVALDGVTFNVLNQTKIIWTALLVYLLLGTRQSPLQIVALTLLCVAAQRETDAIVFTGMYQALLGAVLSALAGSIIQRALQREKRNQYMVTVELSVLGEMTLLTLAFVQDGLMTRDGDSQDGMWDGWSVMTLAALMCQAMGGVLVGFVIRDCGNVEKSFAVVGGMGLTALLETHFNGKPFGHNAFVAMALVAISTALYTLNPPTKKMSADTSELEPFLAPPTVVTVSSNSVHTSSTSRQEMRRPLRQLQPLNEIPSRRELEAIV
ncbi:Drug/Metabolite Transporter (DMT) Superfamily [Phytophthora infestans T30-4]|uniref:Drug/Metabolite Transporter (DMT) Superfamily n=1 Tax=Phytophthora infestans (strain T30-4) TaxID=403677 RepID=D0NE29_PHYIT|nr:Drug/Metabolite Transporter (DMT) Superfamily [Phytophthora infestans T30-4]EEY56474.1 Drug/Metabolite Transporter (DMT) Superfamily [Phytophthora infestans T30-4]|eukprot:XP_002902548.1 Drug/Metabolite Transporter (DMT) Superfamily [Phytophthora infestans T30-4]